MKQKLNVLVVLTPLLVSAMAVAVTVTLVAATVADNSEKVVYF